MVSHALLFLRIRIFTKMKKRGSRNRLCVLGLNEINFEYVRGYAELGHLPNLEKLLDENSVVKTDSDQEYKYLEPWIQWVTIHTGLPFKEHQVFRLGDIVLNKNLKPIFEKIEDFGSTVGAISPFNARNSMRNQKFFVPDPWTNTEVTGGWMAKAFTQSVKQFVNNNVTSKVSVAGVVNLLLTFPFIVPVTRYIHYWRLIRNISKTGRKVIECDSLLSDLFAKQYNQYKSDFSLLFLNVGAHIQHHYLFNSSQYVGELKTPEWYCPKTEEDPLLEVLIDYDAIVGRILKNSGLRLMILTGLHQVPHSELTYYWRPRDHLNLVNLLGVEGVVSVEPRMSGDFLLVFDSQEMAAKAEDYLGRAYEAKSVSSIFSVDNRGVTLFAELIYSLEINEQTLIVVRDTSVEVDSFIDHVAFVAIKNGEHNGEGYLLADFSTTDKERIELENVHELILDFCKP